MSGRIVLWGQADRGQGVGMAHLFWREAENGGAIDAGHVTVCGYDPVHHNGQTRDVTFRPAAPDAVPCSRCGAREEALMGKVFYALGEHPADLARQGR